MAAAFYQAGFECFDVHMSDLLQGHFHLREVQVLAVCGGFSYGDVLGSGKGWASTILYNDGLKRQFRDFFEREDTLTFGVCNGCQMLSGLKELIPDAGHLPRFVRNESEQHESRMTMVKIHQTTSPFLKDMVGWELPVVVSHGEGRVEYENEGSPSHLALSYIDGGGEVTQSYPFNPNGSQEGQTGFVANGGRLLIMMPHPERNFLGTQYTWMHTKETYTPWFQLFVNARRWFDN